MSAVATGAVRGLVEEMRSGGCAVSRIALVVGSDIDPAKLGNAHVRAHALEGRLFRNVLETAAAALGLPSITIVERRLYETALDVLGQSGDALRQLVTALGRPVGPPWGGEEKSAAIAALLALADRSTTGAAPHANRKQSAR